MRPPELLLGHGGRSCPLHPPGCQTTWPFGSAPPARLPKAGLLALGIQGTEVGKRAPATARGEEWRRPTQAGSPSARTGSRTHHHPTLRNDRCPYWPRNPSATGGLWPPLRALGLRVMVSPCVLLRKPYHQSSQKAGEWSSGPSATPQRRAFSPSPCDHVPGSKTPVKVKTRIVHL